MIQHYVPQVYLKNFSIKRKKNYYIDVYDKTNDKCFNTNIANICGELHLYTLTVGNDPLFVENLYSRIFEPLYEEVYNNLINDKIINISNKARERILGAVFQLYFRNAKILNDALDVHTSNIQKNFNQIESIKNKGFTYFRKEFYTNKDLSTQIEEFKENLRESFKIGHMHGFYNLIKTNDNQIISVQKVVDDSKFVTSDNPLKSFNADGSPTNPFLSVSQFLLPLNEKYCLYLYNDKTKNKNKIYRDNVFNGKTFLANGYMIDSSTRFVFGDYRQIQNLLHFKEVVNNDFENNDEKYIQFLKSLLSFLQNEKESSDIINIIESFISLYDKNGHLTNEERTSFNEQLLGQLRVYATKNI